MGADLEHKIETELSNNPIKLPPSPFWDVFKRFGRDEAIALLVNVAGTAGLSYLLSEDLSEETRAAALAVAGPVVEKIGFFPAHFKEAWDNYRSSSKEEREPFSGYFKQALKGGGKSLLQDLLVHDPAYMSLMYAGLQVHPETPAWMLATTSFISAVFAVAGLEVGLNELMYWRRKNALQKIGFEVESYFESRFLLDTGSSPEEIIGNLSSRFSLPPFKKGIYHDRYFKNSFPKYNSRIPVLRLRHRKIEEEREVKSLQVVYTRASELPAKNPEQFRYFPQKKEKIYFLLDQEMPEDISGIEDQKVRAAIKKLQKETAYSDVDFYRTMTNDRSSLFISVDAVARENVFKILELKVYEDTRLLKEAMHYVMRTFPVLQTTHRKFDLF